MVASLAAPIEVSLELTNSCNLECIHCFQPSGRSEEILETVEILSCAEELRKLGVFSVFLSGGEPLLRPDWYDIGAALYDMGFAVGLSTNGCLITKELAQRIRASNLYRILQVSLDGSCSEVHDRIRGRGSFHQTLRGLSCLLDAGIRANIAVTVMKHNIHDVPNIVNLAAEIGVSHVHVMCLMPSGRAWGQFAALEPGLTAWYQMEQNLRALATQYKGEMTIDWGNRRYMPSKADLSVDDYSKIDLAFSGCPAGKSKAVIDCYGAVYGCDVLKQDEFRAGSIRTNRFADIWKESSVFQRWRERRQETIRGTCRDCRWLFACVGGCPAFAVYEGMSIFESDPSCPGPA